MKHVKNLWTLLVAFVVLFAASACDINLHDGETFADFSNEFFFTALGQDEMSINSLFNHPENFGLTHYEPYLPEPYIPSEDDQSSFLGDFLGFSIDGYLKRLQAFDYESLSEDEQITYLIIEDLLNNSKSMEPYMAYLDNSYLGSYLGYQAQLPLVFAEYNFRDQTDVDNYLKLLNLVPSTFVKYLEFEVAKADKGYGMPDFVINKVIDQCDSFVVDIDNNFLIPVFNDKVSALTFLDETQKASYKAQNETAVKTSLKQGYEYLSAHLRSLIGRATNNEGLSHYEGGQKYYELLFRKATGYNISASEAAEYLDAKIGELFMEFIGLMQSNPSLPQLMDSTVLFDVTPLEQLQYYQQEIESAFPSISDYNINFDVKYINESMEDNFSPAAYIISPIDEMANEFIYLNGKNVDSNPNYLYSTLAHEGFPGHLYQNVYFKNRDVNLLRKLLRNIGYTEGWATYAEMYSYRFSDADPKVLRALQLNDEINGAVTARLDIAIHYEGYSQQQVGQYLNSHYMPLDVETLTNLYQQLVEVPTNSQEYYFTYFKLQDMYDKAKTAIGAEFDEKDFHTMILNLGPIPLRFVEDKVTQYIEDKNK